MKAPEIETIVPKVLARVLQLLPWTFSILKSPNWMNLELGDTVKVTQKRIPQLLSGMRESSSAEISLDTREQDHWIIYYLQR